MSGAYPQILMNPSNPLWMYFGTERLYQTSDGAGTWSVLSGDVTGGTGAISVIAAAPGAFRTVAVGTSNGRVSVTTNAGPGGYNDWVDRSEGLPGRPVTALTFDPITPTTLYAGISGFSLPALPSGHVFKSTNLGLSWNDITGALPNIPVNSIVVDPDIP